MFTFLLSLNFVVFSSESYKGIVWEYYLMTYLWITISLRNSTRSVAAAAKMESKTGCEKMRKIIYDCLIRVSLFSNILYFLINTADLRLYITCFLLCLILVSALLYVRATKAA